jgi:hypothetical protein
MLSSLGTRDSDTAKEIHTQRLKVHRDVSIDRTRDSDTAKETHIQRLKMQRDVSIDRRC